VSAQPRYHPGMRLKRQLHFWIVALLVFSTSITQAMTLSKAPLGELVQEADLFVHGIVIEQRTEEVPERSGQLRTRYLLWVWEHLKAPGNYSIAPGLAPNWLEFVQPGGTSDHVMVRVPGVPTFRDGDEVVLLLSHTTWGLQPLGYPLGTFFIDVGGAIHPAWSGHDPSSLTKIFGVGHEPSVPAPTDRGIVQ